MQYQVAPGASDSIRFPAAGPFDERLGYSALPSFTQRLEDRELLSSPSPTKNPAIEWDRFAKAAFDQFLSRLDPDHDSPGGSTLATQIEKYRHSPGGRTRSGLVTRSIHWRPPTPPRSAARPTGRLPTQILKTLAPKLRDGLNREPRVGTTCAPDAPVRKVLTGTMAEDIADTPVVSSQPEALDTALTPAAVQPDVPTPETAPPENVPE